MSITVKTSDQVIADIIAYLQANLAGIITDFNPGSVVRTIIEALSMQIGINDNVMVNLYGQLKAVYDGAYIDTATGEDLSKLVAIVGVSRIPATKAKGKVRFFAVPAPSSDIIIPAGTQVSTQPTAESKQIIFTTDNQATLLASTTFIDVDVTALEAGEEGNVIAGKVTYLATPIFGITSVSNLNSMSGGSEEEDDDNLRERAKAAIVVAGKATSNALKYAVLGITGVGSVTVNDLPIREITSEQHTYAAGTERYTLCQADVINEPSISVTGTVSGSPYEFEKEVDFDIDTAQGKTNDLIWLEGGTKPDNNTIFEVDYRVNKLGEVDMIVAGKTIPMPTEVYNEVKEVINKTKAAGIKVNIIEPDIVNVDITVAITVLDGFDADEVKNKVKENLTEYLDTLDVGYDVLLADIFKVCQETLGVYNTAITDPTSDISISNTEVARAGTITVN